MDYLSKKFSALCAMPGFRIMYSFLNTAASGFRRILSGPAACEPGNMFARFPQLLCTAMLHTVCLRFEALLHHPQMIRILN